MTKWDWCDVSSVKSACCSCRGSSLVLSTHVVVAHNSKSSSEDPYSLDSGHL